MSGNFELHSSGRSVDVINYGPMSIKGLKNLFTKFQYSNTPEP